MFALTLQATEISGSQFGHRLPEKQTPSGGGILTLQYKGEGQMQRVMGGRKGAMLTFSREQQCIEAAASLPSLPLFPFLFSVQNDRDEKLAVDQNTPPTITACFPPHMLSPLFLCLTLYLFLSLVVFPPPFFLFPLFCFCAPLLF